MYLAVGGLASVAALGSSGQATDPTGVLRDVAITVAGRTVIGIIALGLTAHALFRGLLALIGEPYGGSGFLRRLTRRIANATIALGYAVLAATAFKLSVKGTSSVRADDDAAAHSWTARALHLPLGRLLLLAIAVGITIAAVVQLIRIALPGAVSRRLRVEDMSARERTLVAVFGRVALLSRATILVTIAYFLSKATIFRAPRDARGPGGALHAAWESPHGDILLAMMAAGLLAVGVFALIEARWRRLFKP